MGVMGVREGARGARALGLKRRQNISVCRKIVPISRTSCHVAARLGEDLQVQDLVAELARVRRNKIQAGLRELQSALSAVKLLNLGYMEVNQIRPFFKGSLDRFFRLLPARLRLPRAFAFGYLNVSAGLPKVSAFISLCLLNTEQAIVGISF